MPLSSGRLKEDDGIIVLFSKVELELLIFWSITEEGAAAAAGG